MKTRVFQSGNSQAIHIPKEIQFERLDIEYEIERQGDQIIVRPVPRQDQSSAQPPKTELINDPFVGMWHDRQDLEDTNWLRKLREREWPNNNV